MRIDWTRLFPQTLRYRLFFIFVLVFLIPFSLLNLYSYREIQTNVQEQNSFQEQIDLDNMKRSLEDMMGSATKSLLMVQQDDNIIPYLKYPERYSITERVDELEGKITLISNSFLLSSPPIYYTLMDLQGHFYMNYTPRETYRLDAVREQDWFQRIQHGESPFWIANEANFVYKEASRSPHLITLNARVYDDDFRTVGAVRIGIDSLQWFQSIQRHTGRQDSQLFIVNKRDGVLFQSHPDSSLDEETIDKLSQEQGEQTIELEDSFLYYTSVKALDWHIVKKVPKGMLFKEINELKWKYFFIFLLLSVATIVIILLLSAALTKPLQLLEKKMRAVVASNLKVSLPGNKYKGELHSLADSFNVMVGDMNSLLDRLKIEVKQREATRFQVLLSQMNPHFLLNTLNTIKSISARHHDDDIHEICLSLGRILEVSLNTELDLIYLGKEMEIVTAYIQIQSSRFDYDIEVKYNMDESFHYALVPKFCLQPLVENALIHGFEHMSRTGTIQVSAHAAQHNLLLVVEDNGVGRQEEKGALRKSRGNRVGLQNIRERLFLLFKKEADLVVDYPEQGGCRVQITIPLLLSNPNQKGE